MGRTIADVLRHVNIFPEDLGMATLMEKLPRAENITAVVKHKNGKTQVISVG